MPQRLSVLERRLAIERAHPEVKITPPIANRSKKWEVRIVGEGTAAYDNPGRMLEALEERFPDTAEDDGE